MANITVGNMPTATELVEADLGHFIQSGIDKNASLETLRDLLIQTIQPAGIVFSTAWSTVPTGYRALMLQGQTVLVASYPNLVTNTYVGDSNNPTASAFYRTSDAGGTTRDISGDYFVLPDARGRVVRGLDLTGSVDPDGASRDLGSYQGSAIWGHRHENLPVGGSTIGTPFTKNVWGGGDASGSPSVGDIVGDGINPTPVTSSESRMINLAFNYMITY